MILGIDEVGRGPWAGPLVVGAVVLGDVRIDGLTDSKKLTKKRREELDRLIRDQAASLGLGWVSAREIDEIGLSASLVLATRRAVEQVRAPYHEIIIDGTINFLAGTSKGRYVTTLKKADLLIPSVSAASIIAKVARDNFMADQDKVYPGYKFSSHVGYGTAAHRAAIEKLGVTPLHRLSFAPLAMYRTPKHPPTVSLSSPVTPDGVDWVRSVKKRSPGTSAGAKLAEERSGDAPAGKVIGDLAESEATHYLQKRGHTIRERNWKTKWCEIDIVSEYAGTTYFVEVKYRRQPRQGGGLAAITPKKLRQMTFAAKLYQSSHQPDTDVQLAVCSLTGQPPKVETYLEIK